MNTDNPAHAPTGQWKAEGDRPSSLSDRDLLFARLTVLNGLLDDKTVETASRQTGSSKSLADVFVETGALTTEDRDAVEYLLNRHVAIHDDDLQQSLSSLSSPTASSVDPFSAKTVVFTPTAKGNGPPSSSFGDYEIIETIAEGGMGVVYKARQTKLNRLVALKMIRSGTLADAEQIERFLSEAKAAAKLDHPGIVPVYEVGQQRGQHFFSMAFVEGASLQESVKNGGPFPQKQAAGILKTVAEAVQFAHDQGVVHRDLKPANVLLASGGRQPAGGDTQQTEPDSVSSDRGHRPRLHTPKVTDFGLAKHGESGMTVDGQVIGTPSYMPPEQAEGKQDEIGAVSDVYSLGATLYYLLTGRPPFQAASPTETLRQVIETEPVPPRRLNPDVARDLETICLKCLRKEPSGRYPAAAELADDLGRWLENKPIVARRVTIFEKSRLWCKRKPFVVASIAAVFIVIGVAAFIVNEQNKRANAAAIQKDREATEKNNLTRAEELVDGLKKAGIDQVPAIVEQLPELRQWADGLLKKQFADSRDGSGEKLRLSLALLPRDSKQVGYLHGELLKANPKELPVIRDALKPHQDGIVKLLWETLESDKQPALSRFNAACALATFDTDNKTKWDSVLPFVAGQLVSAIGKSLSDTGRLLEALKPIRLRLAKPVSMILRDQRKTELQKDIALTAILDYAADDPMRLADVLAYAERRQYTRVYDALKSFKLAGEHLAAILKESWTEETPDEEKERIARRQANAAVALLLLRQPDAVWPLLKHSPDPRTRSYIVHRAAPLGVDPRLFVLRLDSETDVSIRRALLMTLGEYDEEQFPVEQRRPLVKKLLAVYESDPDSGVHGCAAWLLRKWRHNKSITEITRKLQANEKQRKTRMQDGDRRWYVNTQGQTFAVLRAGTFRMGSPKSEPGRDVYETPHLRKIGRTFAIATHEVTRAQYARFLLEDRSIRTPNIARYSRTADSPQLAMNWYDAAAYCNWLSKKEGIPESDWCYEKNERGTYAAGMKAKSNYLQLTGYRLPSEAEWEYACRAGTATSRYYGLTETLLPEYARYQANSDEHAWPVGELKPNSFGLFDMLGNANEWCHDAAYVYKVTTPEQTYPENVDANDVSDAQPRVLRGGSFNSRVLLVRSADRNYFRPSNRTFAYGFRPSRTYR